MRHTLTVLSAVLAFAVLVPSSRADSAGDLVIAVDGAFTTPQGEAFAVSYEAVLCCSSSSAENYNLVPGTLAYSSSGPMGAFTANIPGFGGTFGPEGGLWQDGSGDSIVLLLFRTPGCLVDPSNPCQPEVNPNDFIPPGTNINALANGIFAIYPAGQGPTQVFVGDVHVTLVPEPGTLLLTSAGLIGLGVWRRRFRWHC